MICYQAPTIFILKPLTEQYYTYGNLPQLQNQNTGFGLSQFHTERKTAMKRQLDSPQDVNHPLPRTYINLSKHTPAIPETHSFKFILADSCLLSLSGKQAYFTIFANLILCDFAQNMFEIPGANNTPSFPGFLFAFNFLQCSKTKGFIHRLHQKQINK